ncbi:MAG: transcriptional repressor [Bacteroidales bacterium]|nr:transcriptional repressor [Bacteroidales bacterium]
MNFKDALKANGLKATRQRVAVHEVMMELGHASADMVRDRIQSQGTAKVTTSSVYNILSQMALLGIYSHRLSIGGKMFFDVDPTCNLHLYDPQTGQYFDVQDEELMERVESRCKRRRFKGYKVDSVDVTIICHQVQPKKETKLKLK